MRLTAPIRFPIGVVLLWCGVRVAIVQPWAVLAPLTAPLARIAAAIVSGSSARAATAPPASPAPPPKGGIPPMIALTAPEKAPLLAPPPTGAASIPAAREKLLLLAVEHTQAPVRQVTGPVLAPIVPPPPPASPARWSGYAYAFVRQGSAGAALAPGGQLGGSQAGARLAYRIDRAGHVALAARASLPLEDRHGAELAFGIDARPWPALPVRFSLERRVALGDHARNAWSAYAAGGFYEGLGHGFEVEGYAQAGVVGVRSRDLFADGAMRAGRRWPLPQGRSAVLGAGLWAAAQPGVERLDIGPRVAVSGKLDKLPATLALEGRFRVAGSAAPGSGVALTLASDF